MHYIVLFILAALTHRCVSWAGGNLHEIDSMDSQYAVFTFTDDRHESMTTNILMNIFVPNVVMLFIALGTKAIGWNDAYHHVWLFVCFYYCYRAFLILVLLGRKELYSFGYEVSIALVGIGTSLLLNFCFLRKTKGILITVDELREELWFATIVVVYGFVKRLLDSMVHQDDVLRVEQLLAYIRNKFMTFVSKYELTITKANNRICILLYAIMIFEDFNRGPLIRKVERLILPMKRKATLGVMQVTSGINITDEESVLKAYDILCDMLDGKDARELNIHDVYLMAEKYNPDENYAKSIVYIYDKLYNIISKDEALAKQFLFYNEIDDDLGTMGDYADKPVMQEQEFESFGALLEELKDNVYFNLKTTEGYILEGVQESQHVCIEGEKSGWTLVLHDLSNVTIDGNNSTLYSVFGKASVIVLRNCNNFTLKNFSLGYSEAVSKCQGNVLELCDCTNIYLDGLDIYGCGDYGIYAYNAPALISHTQIHNCTRGAILAFESAFEMDSVKIYDCKKKVNNLIESDAGLYMRNLEIFDNKVQLDLIKANMYTVYLENVTIYNNKYRKDSICLRMNPEVSWDENKHLGWE